MWLTTLHKVCGRNIKQYKSARICRESPFPDECNGVTRVVGIVVYHHIKADLRRPSTNLAVAHWKSYIASTLQLDKNE
jgi:hypothetical protein